MSHGLVVDFWSATWSLIEKSSLTSYIFFLIVVERILLVMRSFIKIFLMSQNPKSFHSFDVTRNRFFPSHKIHEGIWNYFFFTFFQVRIEWITKEGILNIFTKRSSKRRGWKITKESVRDIFLRKKSFSQSTKKLKL
jgi:hypothetical protein